MCRRAHAQVLYATLFIFILLYNHDTYSSTSNINEIKVCLNVVRINLLMFSVALLQLFKTKSIFVMDFALSAFLGASRSVLTTASWG